MQHKNHRLQNLVLVDDEQLDKIVAQLPNSFSLIENLKTKVGVSILLAKFEIEATTDKDASAIKKIKRLER